MSTAPSPNSLAARLARQYPYYRRLRWLVLPAALVLLGYWWRGLPHVGTRAGKVGTPASGAGQFAAGYRHSVRIGADGRLYVAGCNDSGLVGPDSAEYRHEQWTAIGDGRNWTRVASGEYYCLALRADSSLWAWGSNTCGELGPGAPAGRLRNPALVRVPGRYVAMAAGNCFSLALTADGQLFAWGDNSHGQLTGRPQSSSAHPDPHRPWPDAIPRRVPGRWTQVVAGNAHVLALAADGRLYAWGSNTCGELGPGAPADRLPHPTPVLVPGRYAQLAAGYDHNLALTADGQLWAWGSNQGGELATPLHSWAATHQFGGLFWAAPRPVPGRWTHVAAGNGFSLALTAGGQLWAWGTNDKGQIGRSPNEDNPVPAPLPGRYRRASGGGEHCLALGRDGRLYAWGDNADGQLGYGTSHDYFDDAPQPEPRASE